MLLLEALINNNNYLSSTLSFTDINNLKVTNITSQSSKCKPGSLFVAKRGATSNSRDGHEYIQHAISLGASAVIIDQNWQLNQTLPVPVIRAKNSARACALLCEAFFGFPSEKLKVIALTGTSGKTSTSFLLHSILKAAGFTPKIIGTLGMGDPGQLTALSHTTMEPEFISEALAHMYSLGVSHVILEASSHGLVLDRVSGLNFSAVGLTNITHDHLDFHGTMPAYIKAKQKLFDDLASENTYKILPYAHKFDPSIEKLPNLFFYDPNIKPEGLNLVGDFQINNAALASKIALCLGVKAESISQGLTRCVAIPGRLQEVKNKRCQIYIDYSHKPDALEAVLKTVRKLCVGRVILVFGCGGERDEHKRPLMGQIANRLADIVIITDDNPRREDANSIRKAIIQDYKFIEIADRKEAIKTALLNAGSHDLVLIAGKGHEDYQIYGERILSFSDYNIALEVLESL